MANCLPFAVISLVMPFAVILCADNECDAGGGGWAAVIPGSGGGGGGTETDFDGITPEIYLELMHSGCAGPYYDEKVPWNTYVDLDPSDYDGVCTYYFELIGQNARVDDQTIKLVDTDGNEYASHTLTAGLIGSSGLDFFRYRVEFVPYAGLKTYAVKFPLAPTPPKNFQMIITCCRIVIRQVGATKTMLQIPMVCWPDTHIGATMYGPPVNGGDNIYDYYHANEWINKWGRGSWNTEDDYYSYANDVLQIWKYDETELSTISSLKLDAIAGQQYDHGANGPQGINDEGQGTVSTATFGVYEKVGIVYTLVPDSLISYSGSRTLWDLPLSVGSFVDGREYYVGQAINGNPVSYHFWFLFLTGDFPNTISSIYYRGDTGATGQYGEWRVYMDFFYFSASPQGMQLGLYDRTADSIIAESVLSWTSSEVMSRKSATISPSLLTIGHSYEIRVNTEATVSSGAPWLESAVLYLKINPISRLTVWQRIGIGNQAYYWGFIDANYVGNNSRIRYFGPGWAGAKYEITCTFYDWEGGVENYQAVWDGGSTDSGSTGGEVSGSRIEWTIADQNGNERILRRSPCLDLVNDVRYCDTQPDRLSWLYPVQGFLLVGHVEGCVLPPSSGGGNGSGSSTNYADCPPYGVITDLRPMAVFDCVEEECD